MTSQSVQRQVLDLPPEFDFLPIASALEVRPAVRRELKPLAHLAASTIPGVQPVLRHLEMMHARDPESFFSFRQAGNLIGGCAFLYLNYRGHDALMLDRLNTRMPDLDHLAEAGECPEAIYWWGTTGAGRSALGPIAARFAGARYRAADIYGRVATARGRELMVGLGFRPVSSWSGDLWVYRRCVDQRALDQAA
jgi:hypothetical protein